MKPSRKKQKIIILCEGDTEEYAIKYFVQRQWKRDGFEQIGLHPINLDGQLGNITRYVQQYAQDEEVIAIFTLVDLYGMKQVQHRNTDELPEKVERVKEWLRRGLSPEALLRFHPHVSVHEVEAWLLADGTCLARRLKDNKIQPDPHAETRNFENPPSHLLKKLFKRYRTEEYAKIADGIPLFQSVDFMVVYNSCAYFKAFYDDLKKIARKHLKKAL